MVKVYEDNLGSRIRKARNDKHIKMKDFAEIVGITPNYLGLIERGVKKPSPGLLQVISDNTDVSYAWLLNGTENKQQEEKPTSSLHYTVASVNLQLFLPILMSRLSFGKEKLADYMGIDTTDVEKIISGENYDFDPSWDSILSGMTQKIDLKILINQLETLVGFFRDKYKEKVDWELFTSIKQYADKTHDAQYQLMNKIEVKSEYIQYDYFSLSLFPKQITLVSETSGRWIFKYYETFGYPQPDPDINSVGAILDSQKESHKYRMSIISDDPNLYNLFCDCYATHGRNTSCGIDPDIQIFSFVLIDKETLKIIDKQTFDPDDPA